MKKEDRKDDHDLNEEDQEAGTQEQQEHKNTKTEEKRDEVDYKDKYVRLLAEYTNSLKQKDEELKSMAQFGNRNLLLKVLDIVDDIETGLMQDNLHEETKGILQLLQSKVTHLLTLEGVKEIEVQQGDAYDSSKAEVITMIEDEANKGKISQIVRKGYMMGDRVLRTAKVIIGK